MALDSQRSVFCGSGSAGVGVAGAKTQSDEAPLMVCGEQSSARLSVPKRRAVVSGAVRLFGSTERTTAPWREEANRASTEAIHRAGLDDEAQSEDDPVEDNPLILSFHPRYHGVDADRAIYPEPSRLLARGSRRHYPAVGLLVRRRLRLCQASQHHPHDGRRLGVLGHRLLRRRDQHARARRSSRSGASLPLVLQPRALLPHAGVLGHGAVSAPSWSGPHDVRVPQGRRADPVVPGQLEQGVRHYRRGSRRGGLHNAHEWQVACHAIRRNRPEGRTLQLAHAARLRQVLRDDPRSRLLLRSRFAQARQRAGRPRPRLLLHDRYRREREPVHQRGAGRESGQALLPLHAVHVAALAAARPRGSDRQVQGSFRHRLGQAPRGALGAHAGNGRGG